MSEKTSPPYPEPGVYWVKLKFLTESVVSKYFERVVGSFSLKPQCSKAPR